MKKYLFAFTVFTIFSISALTHASGQKFYGSIAGSYIFPSESEWDNAIGGDLRLGLQFNENIRLFGLFSFNRWDLNSDRVGDISGGSYAISGDADVYSVGGGAEFLIPLSYKLTASVSASIQKQFVDSNISSTLTNDEGQVLATGSADIKDGVAAFVGVDLLYALSDALDVFAGAGYLFSLDDPTVSQFIGPDLFETKFQGFVLRAGLSF